MSYVPGVLFETERLIVRPWEEADTEQVFAIYLDPEVWRQQMPHREAQARGRAGVFRDYRLRIASVVRDYGMNERDEAPIDSRQLHG